MKKQRLWIVTEFFYPDETATAFILTNVANKLSEKYEVNVICGPISDHIPSINKLNPDIKMQRSNVFNVSKDKLLMRSIRFICIGLILTFKLLWYSRKKDKVMIVTNPAPLVILASWIKAIRGFDFSILVHDVFPENAVSAGVIKKNNFVYKILKPMFDRAYSRANKLIVLGRDMADVLYEKISNYSHTTEIKVITNWADVDLINIGEPISHNKIIIQYAGNIGRVQGLKEFISHFADAKNRNVVFSLWGKGAMEKGLKQIVYNNNLSNIEFKGPFTRAEQNEIISQSDICLVTLVEGMFGLGVPSKTYNIMAAGKPILYIGPRKSEIFRMLEESKAGYCFEPSDENGIVTFLRGLNKKSREEFVRIGLKGRELVTSKYTKEIILNHFMEVI